MTTIPSLWGKKIPLRVFFTIQKTRKLKSKQSSVWAFPLKNFHNLKIPAMQKARTAKIHLQKCSAAFTQSVVKK